MMSHFHLSHHGKSQEGWEEGHCPEFMLHIKYSSVQCPASLVVFPAVVHCCASVFKLPPEGHELHGC